MIEVERMTQATTPATTRPTAPAARPALDLVIRGGRVVTAGSEYVADIGILDGEIVQIGRTVEAGAREIDATGKLVMPGGIDMHVHLTPVEAPGGGAAWVDDFESGSQAAAAGGVTTVGNITFIRDGDGLGATIERVAADAERDSIVDFVMHPILLSAHGMLEQIPELVAAGCRSIKFFMMFPSFDTEVAEYVTLMEAAGQHGLVTMIHCEDACVVGHVTQKLMAAGHSHPTNYGAARPIAAEATAVTRAVAYSEATGAPVYIVHLSSGAALEVAVAAKARGVQVSVETRPIYLLFDDTYLERPDGPLYIGNPPLRKAADMNALWSGLATGAVDTCCTDHAPAPRADKVGAHRDITNVSPGMADLDTMLPLLYSRGVHTGRISIERFVELTSTNAAKIFGLYPQKGTIAVGSDADLLIWDPDAVYTFHAEDAQTRTDYSLYDGWEINGRLITTISRGEVIYDGGRIVATRGRGRHVRRSVAAPA
jgi:dihydropyrimidinase